MKTNFPVIRMPEEYIYLLKTDINSAKEMIHLFAKKFSNNAGMIKRIQSIFHEFDYAKRIPGIINSLGWKGFRDRLGSVYLYHALHGQFPVKSNLSLVQDIVDFDADFSEHTVRSSSRVFMLGLYLNMAEINLQQEQRDDADSIGLSYLPPEVKKVLMLSAGKTVHLDWLILSVWHLISFNGHEWTVDKIKATDGNFQEIYKELSSEQKKLLNNNYLSYGCSTYEFDLFTQESTL